MSDARSRLARLGLPCCVGLVALSPLASCTRTTVSDPIDLSALPAGTDGELEFWHTLPGRSAVTNNEGLHGLLLLIDGQDAATTYEERTDLLKQRGWMDTDFSEPADMAMQRGTLAKALTGSLDIRGGVMMHLSGRSPRYSARELAYLGILQPNTTSNQVISGLDYIAIISRAQDYRLTQDTRAAAQARRAAELKSELQKQSGEGAPADDAGAAPATPTPEAPASETPPSDASQAPASR